MNHGQRHRGASDTALVVGLWLLGGALTMFGSLLGVTALVAAVTGHHAASATDLLGSIADRPGNPLAALPRYPGPAPVIYGLWIVLLLAMGAGVVWLARRHHESERARWTGHARSRDLSTMHEKNAIATAQETMRRSLHSDADRPLSGPELVMAIGRHAGRDLFAQHEDSMTIIAPARSGKTNFVAVPRILDAPGPCVVTGTKSDVVLLTAIARRRVGKVMAFDPQGIAGWPDAARWDPVAGCEDPEEALDRAKAWAAGGTTDSGAGNARWFQERAAEVLAYLLHAAAMKPEGSLRDVVGWAADFSDIEPMELLRSSPHVAPARWADQLRARTQSRAGETTDSLAMTLSGLLAPLASPRILDALCPPPAARFDVARFLEGRNTLYLLTGKGGLTVAPLLTMFTDYIVRSAQNISQTQPGERLWPPLRLVLDEAANVAPIPRLPEIMSDSGGRGITTIALCQSFAQMDHRWGRDEAETIRANATVTMYLPGIKEQSRLEELSDATGRHRVQRRTVSSDGSSSTSSEWEPVMTPDDIRRMPVGEALIFYRGLKAARVQLTPWWDRSDAKQIRDDLAEAEQVTGRKMPPESRAATHPADLPDEVAA